MSEIDLLKRNESEGTRQFSTFYVAGRLYGIDVSSVQEVTKALPITKVPLAPKYIHGLINLRGQIATAICLRDLFNLQPTESNEFMNVVCREDGMLVSLLVDKIGDVIELGDSQFENTPDTVSGDISKYMDGVYKVPNSLVSILKISKIVSILTD